MSEIIWTRQFMELTISDALEKAKAAAVQATGQPKGQPGATPSVNPNGASAAGLTGSKTDVDSIDASGGRSSAAPVDGSSETPAHPPKGPQPKGSASSSQR